MSENNITISKKTKKLNSFFDFGLFSEGIRQLRIAGFVSFLLINIVAVLIPLGQFVSVISMRSYAKDGYFNSYDKVEELYKYTVEFPYDYIYMYAIFIIVAPLLTLILFHFLNKRNACDYFHAFPQKRSCIYISYISAVIAWIFVITFGTVIVSGFTYLCLTGYVFISYAMLLKFAFSMFICALLVVAAVAFACSITGNLFSNVVTTALILFFPRLLMYVTTMCVTESSSLFVSNKLLPILDARTNLMLAAFFDASDSLYSLFSIGYTIILALIYFLAAGLCFIKRRSESAGYSANNRFLQFIFRLCAGLPLSFFVIFFFFEMIIGGYSLDIEELFLLFVLEIVCIIIMLLYELLSTRKLIYVLKALITIPVFFVVQVAILVFTLGLFFMEFNYSPDAEDIDYIYFTSEDEYSYDYYSEKIETLKIKNKEINEIVSRSLDKSIDYYYKRMLGQRVNNTDTHRVTIGIKSGLTVKYRRILMSEEDYAKYTTLLFECKEFADAYSSLPEYDSMTMSVYSNYFTDSQSQDIYNILVDEVASLEPGEWYRIMQEENYIASIRLETYVNNTYTYTWIPLTGKTPKALLAYINYSNEILRDEEFFASIDKTKENMNDVYTSIDVRCVDESFYNYVSYYSFFTGDEYDPELLEKLFEAIKSGGNTTFDSLSTDNKVLISYYIYSDYTYNSCEGFCFIDKELAKALENDYNSKYADDDYIYEIYD